jgi:hypothetical protein
VQSPILGLRYSLTYRTSVELYQRHDDAGSGACTTCGNPAPCPARRHATSVIVAAGEDPRSYNARPSHDVPATGDSHREEGTDSTSRSPTPRSYPPHTGYHLGGRGRPANPEGFFYDRDSP